MRADFPRRLERLLLAAMGILILVILVGGSYLLRSPETQEPTTEPTAATEEPTQQPTESLSGPEFYLPEKLAFGEKLPHSLFWDAQGQQVDILEKYQ